MDNNANQVFIYKAQEVRTVDRDGEVWFVGKDIAQALDYSETTVNNAINAVREKYYTATELGKMLGVSSKKIGRVAKANGVKSDEGSPSQFGQWRLSKSPYSAHECPQFMYNSNALDWFREHQELLA